MEIYLVGGAVRDELLGLTPKEKDYVVVGATVDEMLKKGFRQVGKDFPVFLHPKTQEEYALARVERKVGRGYTGFNFDTSSSVTLKEDLMRRDLTINAMARPLQDSHSDVKADLIDPYHGYDDLNKKLLRHVSPAFIEDPVRILRVARFAARFAEYGFTIAPETLELMRAMVKSGEVDALVAERVWKEWERSLQEKNPEKFFEVLADCEALPVLFSQLKKSNITALSQIAKLSSDAEIRFAVLLHDLAEDAIKLLCDSYRVPSQYRELALIVAKHYQDCLRAEKLSAEQLLDLLRQTDAFRREARFKKFLAACEAIAKISRPPVMSSPEKWLTKVLNTAKAVDTRALSVQNLGGKEIGEAINKHRIAAINNLLKPV